MSLLREFNRNVVPHHVLKCKIDVGRQADDKEAEERRKRKEEEALAAQEKAAAAAYKADIMGRLAALIAPYKEAVADGGADAKYLQAQLAKVKAAIAKHCYAEAGKQLDVLEEMLDEWGAAEEEEKCEREEHVHRKDRHHDRPWSEQREEEEEYDQEHGDEHGEENCYDEDRPHRNRVNYVEDEENGRPVKHGMGVDIDDVEIKCREQPHRRRRTDDCNPPPSVCPPEPACPPPVCPPEPVCPPPPCPPQNETPPACPPEPVCPPPPACPPPGPKPRPHCDPDVQWIQQALCERGYSPGPIDGIMGPKTKAAIMAFQKANGLKVDGIVGPQTRAALGGGGCPKPPPPKPQPQPAPVTPSQPAPTTQQQATQVTQNPQQTAQQTTVQNPEQNQAQSTQVNPNQNTSTTTQVNPNQSTSTSVNPNQNTQVNPTINQNPNQTTQVSPTQTNGQQQSNNNNQQVTVPVTVVVNTPAGPAGGGQTNPSQTPTPADNKEHDADWKHGAKDVVIGIVGGNRERAAEGAWEIGEDIYEHVVK